MGESMIQRELPEMLGTVEWFSNEHGHGMALGEDGTTFWLHYSEFPARAKGWRVELWVGQTVKFRGDLLNPRGPRAVSVEVVK